MTVLEGLANMATEKRVAVVGYADGALLGIRGLDATTVASAAWKTWACPDYLAERLGIAFECQHPRTVEEKTCIKCTASFLRAHYQNTKGKRNDREKV